MPIIRLWIEGNDGFWEPIEDCTMDNFQNDVAAYINITDQEQNQMTNLQIKACLAQKRFSDFYKQILKKYKVTF